MRAQSCISPRATTLPRCRRLVMEDIAQSCSSASSSSSDSDGAFALRDGATTRVVAFDRPPFGLSSRPVRWSREWENPYTQEAAAETCIGLMDMLGMDRWVG